MVGGAGSVSFLLPLAAHCLANKNQADFPDGGAALAACKFSQKWTDGALTAVVSCM